MIIPESLTASAGSAYLIVIFVGGLLTNFVPLGPINTGTILLYSLAGFLSFAGVLYLLGPLRKHVAIAAFLLLILSCLAVFKAVIDANPMSQRARELAIFFLGALPFLFFIQIDDPAVRQRFLRILAIGLFGLSVFAIFQSVFADHLPLNLFVLRGDDPFAVADTVSSSIQLRPTGLTGNPIILSSILVFASSYFAAQWLERRKLSSLVALFCSLVGNYLTYTRASFILVIPVLSAVWLFHKRFRIRHKIMFVAAGCLAVIGAQYLLSSGADVIILRRLQNSDPEAIQSTLGHLVQIQNAESAIMAHPLIGTGIGSQGDFVGPQNAIITDGAWWALVLEFGVPLSLLVVASLCIVLTPLTKYVLRQSSGNRALAIATLSFHAYLFPANFINSAILGHVSFGLYWALLGLSLAGIPVTLQRPKPLVRFRELPRVLRPIEGER